MTSVSREQVLGALLQLASDAADFKSVGRRLVLSSQVTSFPALYVISVGENYPPRDIRGLPPKVTIDAQIWVYADGGKSPDVPPEAALNDALDSVEAALQPSIMQSVQTLNLPGVYHCWIEGQIEKFPGVLDGIAKAIIPVKILLA